MIAQTAVIKVRYMPGSDTCLVVGKTNYPCHIQTNSPGGIQAAFELYIDFADFQKILADQLKWGQPSFKSEFAHLLAGFTPQSPEGLPGVITFRNEAFDWKNPEPQVVSIFWKKIWLQPTAKRPIG